MKLTGRQTAILEWLASLPDGADYIRETRVATALIEKGLARYSILQDAWFITDAGRLALRSTGGE